MGLFGAYFVIRMRGGLWTHSRIGSTLLRSTPAKGSTEPDAQSSQSDSHSKRFRIIQVGNCGRVPGTLRAT